MSALSCPDQYFAVLIHSEALGLDDLRLEVFEVVVVKRETALEGAIGDTPLALEKVERLGEDFIERHRRPQCQRIENVRRRTGRSLVVGRKCREIEGVSQLVRLPPSPEPFPQRGRGTPD